MNKYTHQVQGIFPGFEIRKYRLEKALECTNYRPAGDNDRIVRIRLVALVIDANDGNGTEISVRARTDVLHYFQRYFYPLEQGAEIRCLRFHLCFRGAVSRTVTLRADRLIAAPDEFTALFEQYLVAEGVAYAEEPD